MNQTNLDSVQEQFSGVLETNYVSSSFNKNTELFVSDSLNTNKKYNSYTIRNITVQQDNVLAFWLLANT